MGLNEKLMIDCRKMLTNIDQSIVLECEPARNFDPSYCLTGECYPDLSEMAPADGPWAGTGGGAVVGSGPAQPEPSTDPGGPGGGVAALGGTATLVDMVPFGPKIELHGFDFLRERKIQGSSMGSNRFRTDMPRLIEFYMQRKLHLDD
jgi:hypothetical protein